MTDDSDDIRDIRLMVMGETSYPGAVWRESVRDLLSEIDRLTAERDALREAASGLIDIVEGVRGAMEHGTWRAERSNLRMKDTDECVAFYNAARAALKDT